MQRFVDAVKPHVPRRTRRRVLRGRFAVRRLTARHRVLPDFLVIGAMRCGTSSLYKYLGYHPRIAPSLRKETEWFTRFQAEDEWWYRAHFPLAARAAVSAAVGRPLLSFEATPDYLFAPHVPSRVHDLLPDARLVAVLRNPVDRAYSHFQHTTRHGWEDVDFPSALGREEDRIGPDLRRMAAEPSYWGAEAAAFSYVARGRYAEQLARWFDLFDRDRVLVLTSEELYADPSAFYAQVLDFLGLPQWRPRFRNYSHQEAGPSRRMDPEVREQLVATFREPNRRLYELLGRDLGWDG
jgi:Sulfotransferase domain